MPSYGYSKRVSGDFQSVVDRTTAALAQEGFGVLTTIDVQAKMKEKLGIDTDRYVILGACNPAQAHRAITAEKEIGLLLPCNVIVYETEGTVTVSAMKPSVAMNFVENQAVHTISAEVEASLERAINTLS